MWKQPNVKKHWEESISPIKTCIAFPNLTHMCLAIQFMRDMKLTRQQAGHKSPLLGKPRWFTLGKRKGKLTNKILALQDTAWALFWHLKICRCPEVGNILCQDLFTVKANRSEPSFHGLTHGCLAQLHFQIHGTHNFDDYGLLKTLPFLSRILVVYPLHFFFC